MGIAEKVKPVKTDKQAPAGVTKKAQVVNVIAHDNKAHLKEEVLPSRKVLVGFGHNYN
jgi:hypothetical protein